MNFNLKYSLNDGDPIKDPSMCKRLIRKLQYTQNLLSTNLGTIHHLLHYLKFILD